MFETSRVSKSPTLFERRSRHIGEGSRGERGEGGSKCTCVLPFHRLQFGHEAFTNGLFSLFRSLE